MYIIPASHSLISINYFFLFTYYTINRDMSIGLLADFYYSSLQPLSQFLLPAVIKY